MTMGSAKGPKERPSLRARQKASVQREIALCATDLFESQGFHETTVEQITETVGVSLRTFYRHCPVKEEALTPLLTEGVDALVAELQRRPDDEPLPVAARAALTHAAALPDNLTRRVTRVTLAEPALTARWLAAGRRAQDLLIPVVAARLGRTADDLAAATTAGLLINVATTALEYWARHENAGPLGEVTAEAFTAVADFGRLPAA
ncbi:TetR family transcriptional regulator [Streptomyces scabiei]|uniref:acyl-CoA-like ligand-binding transcription factor n=1 Tax=Streptomyces scabiei TaxID=1930 RepID=UPI0036AC4821